MDDIRRPLDSQDGKHRYFPWYKLTLIGTFTFWVTSVTYSYWYTNLDLENNPLYPYALKLKELNEIEELRQNFDYQLDLPFHWRL